MKNVYDGTVVLDRDGRAVVGLADWFEALNRDYRYQLTPIGGPAPHLHIVAEVSRPKTRDGTCILNSTTRSRSPASPVSARTLNGAGRPSTAMQRPDSSRRARCLASRHAAAARFQPARALLPATKDWVA